MITTKINSKEIKRLSFSVITRIYHPGPQSQVFVFFLVPFNASSNTALFAFSIPYLSVEWQDALKISKALKSFT